MSLFTFTDMRGDYLLEKCTLTELKGGWCEDRDWPQLVLRLQRHRLCIPERHH